MWRGVALGLMVFIVVYVVDFDLLWLAAQQAGVRFQLLDDLVEIAPGFPADWTHADIKLKDISLTYSRSGREENLTVHCEARARMKFKLPLRSTSVEEVLLNGEPANYVIEPGG